MSARVVVVTGARKGLGRGLCEYYLERGCLVDGCSRQASTLTHENYRHHLVDVSDESAVVRMIRDVGRARGHIDVLLNNAGIAAMNHVLLTPGETARRVTATNFLGTFHCLREAGKLMARRGRGWIVNFSTVAVPMSLEGEAIYAASKAAVETLTRVAARELGSSGVMVNAIGPTPIDTDLIRVVPSAKIAELVGRQAIKRKGEFADLARVVEFLSAADNTFVTGQVIYLGGVHG
jgi:3-oxoacyl-[acyl-carrier protein] reductase